MVRAAGAVLLLLAACSDDGGEASTTTSTTPTTIDRPDGPAADLSTELSGGKGVNIASPAPPDEVLEGAGYEQHEYAASGTATSYAAVGELGEDGQWTVEPKDTADFTTRVVVRRPADPAEASGVVVVEWLNVSGGLDADPDWQMFHEDVLRNGDTWVGVSAQALGIMGGPVRVSTPQSEAAGAGKGLRVIDPERYGDLDHPGDDYAYDIFTQVARSLRAGDALDGIEPTALIADGESQSAFAMVTYLNAVQPLTEAFDGFLVHSRGGASLPLVTGGAADIASALGGTPTIIREDTTVPVMELQSESDVTGILASAKARQDDTETFRLWEMAGTSHADTRSVGELSGDLGCGAINDGPMHLIVKAGYRALVSWVLDGNAPTQAPRLDLTADAAPTQARDDLGIATGGIRTPLVDVPVDVLTGAPGANSATVCILSGQTIPLSDEDLAARYASRADYQTEYAESAEEAIDTGYVLEADRGALMAKAQPDRIPA